MCADVPKLESPGRVGGSGTGRLGRGTAVRVDGFALAAYGRMSAFHIGDDGEDARGSGGNL